MSASNATATSISYSEHQTLVRFLGLYTFLALLIVTLGGTIYFRLHKDLMLQNKRLILESYSKELIDGLKLLHIYFDSYRTYPRNSSYRSAIYDADKVLIFSTLKNPHVRLNKVIYTTGNVIQYVHVLDSYYLGAKYVVIEIDDNKAWFIHAWRTIIFYGGLALILFLGVGLYLLRLFLSPMKHAIRLLDRFIKDTTHELNTPVNAILTNIETIDIKHLDEKTARKIRRIDIGARTISTIYQDLTYLTLNHQIASQDQTVDMSKIVSERIDYFKILAESKKISIISDISPGITYYIDPGKISRLIDNLLSNAIKYNKRGGTIFVLLHKNSLCVRDTGMGMDKREVEEAFKRYKRFDTSVGGFGIGLNIVAMIANEYNFDINIESKKKEGTNICIKW